MPYSDPEKRKEYQRYYRETFRNKEEHNRKNRELYQRTKEQKLAKNAEWRKAHPQKQREYTKVYFEKIGPEKAWEARIRRNYKLTREEYDIILALQDFGCAICGMTEQEHGRHLYVDHDHSCCPQQQNTCGNCVRGLLCDKCNNGISRFNDDAEIIDNAAHYIRFWNEENED